MTTEKERLDRIASEYGRSPYEKFLAEMRIGALRLVGEDILEMGCGAGMTTLQLSHCVGRMTVVDAAERSLYLACNALDRLQGLKLQEAIYHCVLWEEYEPEQQFTDVALICGLEHVEEPVSLLKRMKGWLQPGGRIHVIVPNVGSIHRHVGVSMGLIKQLATMSEADKRVGHRHLFTKASLRDALHLAGLRASIQGLLVKPMQQSWMEMLSPNEWWTLAKMARTLDIGLCAELYAIAEPQAQTAQPG